MAGPPKSTVMRVNARVAAGSALERLLQGRPMTETLHKMAELIEMAPQAVRDELPVVVGVDIASGEDQTVISHAEEGRVLETAASPPGTTDSQPYVDELQRRVQRRFTIGHDQHTMREVTEDEVLALAREQYPAGLVPVGIDEGDPEPEPEAYDTLAEAADAGEDDDLGYLA